MGRLTSVIDEIKKQTKITEQFITTAHTGRAKHAEGDERARGATALDDWVDSRIAAPLREEQPVTGGGDGCDRTAVHLACAVSEDRAHDWLPGWIGPTRGCRFLPVR